MLTLLSALSLIASGVF